MKRYKIKEIHQTFQGEGVNAGRAVTLIRMTGCNIWSGREQDRAKASEKGLCAMWCDTDFVGADGSRGGAYTLSELIECIGYMGQYDDHWAFGSRPSLGVGVADRSRTSKGIVMITGGEPSLQVDADLIKALCALHYDVALETNGTKDLTPLKDASLDQPGRLWITLSPKPPSVLHPNNDTLYDEVKLVYDPSYYDGRIDLIERYESIECDHFFVQPLDQKQEYVNAKNTARAMQFVRDRGAPWTLGIQSHKIWDLP